MNKVKIIMYNVFKFVQRTISETFRSNLSRTSSFAKEFKLQVFIVTWL